VAKKRSRGLGEGSIFEERLGRWIALVTTGWEFRNGKRRRIRKKFVATTREEVAKKLNEGVSKQNHGISIAPSKKTLGDFLADWLEHTVKPSVRPKTYRSYEQMVRNHLAKTVPPAEWKKKKLDKVPGLAAVKLRALSVEALEQFFNAKLAAGNSPALVRYLRTVLRITLNEALRRGLIEQNVAELVRPLHVPKPKLTPFTFEEAHRLLAAGERSPAGSAFHYGAGYRTAARRSTGPPVDDVDLKAGTLNVFHTLQRIDGELRRVEPKSEESRRAIPLEPFCIAALKQHRKVQSLERAAARGRLEGNRLGVHFTNRNAANR
jgi:hypothetical protein